MGDTRTFYDLAIPISGADKYPWFYFQCLDQLRLFDEAFIPRFTASPLFLGCFTTLG